MANTLADIDAAYEWLLAHGRKPSDVILYGVLAPPEPPRYARSQQSPFFVQLQLQIAHQLRPAHDVNTVMHGHAWPRQHVCSGVGRGRCAGQSVGSGPTCYLASKAPDLGGVVLHSALASGDLLWV